MPPKQSKQAVYKAKQPSMGSNSAASESKPEQKPAYGAQNEGESTNKPQQFQPRDTQNKEGYQQQYPPFQKRGGAQYGGGQRGFQNNRDDEQAQTGYRGPNKYPQKQNNQGAGHINPQISYKDLGGITPQMLAQTPSMLPHLANLQQMDQVELESLVLSLLDKFGTDILAQQVNTQGQPYRGQGGRGRGSMNYQTGRGGIQQNDRYQPFVNNFQDVDKRQGQFKGRSDMPLNGQNAFPSMQQSFGQGIGPQPRPKSFYQAKTQKQDYSDQQELAAGDQADSDQTVAGSETPTSSEQPDETSQRQPPTPGAQFGQQFMMNPGQMPLNFNMFGAQQNQMTKNLCQKHFPEPIILFLDGPKCKKCIPEQVALKLGKVEGQQKSNLPSMQTIQTARMLGLNSLALNIFQTEKSQISRSLERLNMFRRELQYMQDDIKQRQDQSSEYLEQLPPLMNSMFAKLEELVNQGESKFKNKISQIVRNQQKNIQDDMKTKLPQFYQRLVQKYSQLQQASNLAQQKGAEDLILTLQHYFKIFNELDAEYEKYFNDYEKMSKLQRLLDKDANEIVEDFNDLVDRNLRVDYNIKNSFGPHLPQRLHSFQWNQRCSQIYRIKTGQFEKKPVQMQYEVPLYSRSIATETGTIYLIGGFIKQANIYLKSCHRYDEIFGILQPVAQMNYPHADHSVCSIGGFIYVVGTFVNNQVYGWCEVYDMQKDKWKQIDEMRVPRTGVSLCTFKNNYIFAFGGRVDQKRIVDAIEVYDISRNVWQEIDSSQVDKTKWVPAYMGLAYQITDNEIIVFGGKSAITFQIFNGCFVFDVEKMEIKERGSLVNPCSFMNTPLVFNNNLYAYGNDVYVHCYNIPEHKWSAIPKSSVVLPKS